MFFLYGSEILILILTREHTLRVFENRVLRVILGLKREKVVGGWRRLLNEELHKLCTSQNIIFFKKALTILHGPLAYPNGLLDLHIETFGRTT
jgi:hypothetical protein